MSLMCLLELVLHLSNRTCIYYLYIFTVHVLSLDYKFNEVFCFEGEFGVIYRGYYKSGVIDAVAVKTLKGKLLDGLHNIVELDG